MTLPELVVLGAKTSLLLTVFGLGLRSARSEVLWLLRRPGKLARSIGTMFVLMPIVAVALAFAFDLSRAVRFALGTLAISPVPPLWPTKSLRAGGSESYTIGLLVATSVLAIVTIPLSVELFQLAIGTPLGERPARIADVVLKSILLPLGAGMLVRRLAPGPAERLSRPVVIVAQLMLAAAMVPIVVRLWPAFGQLVGNGTVAAMVLFVAIGLLLGHLFGGPPTAERIVLALAASSRHPGIAIAITIANYPDHPLAPAAILLYLLISLVATIPYLAWARRRHAPGARRSSGPGGGDRPEA